MPLPANPSGSRVDRDRSPDLVRDDEIVQHVLGGDAAAFEMIMRRYNQRLFRISRSILGDDTEAEDVVQETYYRAYQNLRQFEGRSSFATWLTKIAVYEASSRRRNRRRMRIVNSSALEFDPMSLPSSDSGTSDDEASREELRLVLARAIDALPEDLRIVFTLRMVERLSTAEVADCLELTPANVKIRLHRARLQLRAWIDRRIGAESRQLFMFDGERCDRIVRTVMSRLFDRQ